MNGKIDHGLDHIPHPSKTIFSAETYVGNWYEETVKNTVNLNDFLRKRECEDLSIQRSQIMSDILLKPVGLTERADGFVHYGDSVQLISPGPDCTTAIEAFPFKNYCKLGHLTISAAVPPHLIDEFPYLNTDSIISASPHLFPCVRNSFVIEKPDCPEDNKTVLRYGEVFRIRTMPTQRWTLYLYSAPGIPHHSVSTHSAKPLVRFSDTKNSNTLWKFIPLDPKQKVKMELGLPVPLKTRMLLQHALSGQNLSIEPDFSVQTYFGRELEVTVNTKLNRVRKVIWSNHWVVDTERGWRKPDPHILAQAKLSSSINVNSEQANTKNIEEEDNCACTKSENDPQAQICPQDVEKFQKMKISEDFMEMTKHKIVPGQTASFNWHTPSLPDGEQYRMDGEQSIYPNRKWHCGDTKCCDQTVLNQNDTPSSSTF